MAYAEYLRKSRHDNPDETLEETLARHRKLLAEYMVRAGISVLPEDVYEEVVSGDSLYARPQMLRLLEAVEMGKYEGVVCMDIQRLGRGSMTDQGAILDAFKYSHTKILTPTKTYDLDNDTDETYTEFETFLGRQELRMIKKRLQRGIKATVEGGGYVSNAPYGYEQTRVGKTPTLKIRENEAKFVRMMFDLYLKGMGCQRIADTISAMGARPRRGEVFSRNTVRKILQSPTYIGKVVWNQKSCIQPGKQGNGKHMVIHHPRSEWVVVDGLHPAIIDEDTFRRVQEIFDSHPRSPTFTGVIENPLSGVVVCGNCGAHMQRQMHERGGPYLICQRRGCMVSSQLPLVERAILEQLRAEVEALSANQQGDDNEAGKKAELTEALRGIELDIRTARQQDDRLHDLLEQGVYDVDTFMERHALLAERIAKLESTKKQLQPKERPLDVEGMQQRIRAVLEAYAGASPQTRSELLKSVIDRVIYRKEPGAKPADFELEMYLKPMY